MTGKMRKRVQAGVLVLAMLFSVCQGIPGLQILDFAKKAEAAAANGIYGNGTGGIYIDVNSAPYTTYANIPTWGQYAYGPSGCAWFASARVKQLTGKGSTIYSGTSWYNSAYQTCGFSRGSEMKAPALVCWSGHVAVLEKISGNTAYISEGGCHGWGSGSASGYTIIRAVTKSALTGQNAGFLGYVYLPGSSSGSNPQGCLDFCESKEDGKLWVRGWAYDPDNTSTHIQIHVYIGGEGQSLGETSTNRPDVDSYYHCGAYHGFDSTIITGKSGAQQVDIYAINIGGGDNTLLYSGTVNIRADTQKPIISNVSVYDVTENGYKVKCKATDNVGVDRVQFPTWTEANDQDDIQKDWWSNSSASGKLGSDGYYTYEVKISDHNNEHGSYVTHIYAYDKAGNSVCYGMYGTAVEKAAAATATPVPSDESTKKADGDALAAAAEQEYSTYQGQSYNYQYGTSPWCCNFVSWCARQAGISTDVIKSTATVQTLYDSLINGCGAKVVTTPQRGDLVFYKYTNYDSGKFHHIGIMTGAAESIQGNVNNTWWKGRPAALDNIKEMVYVRPAYNNTYVAPAGAYFSDYSLNKTEDTNAEVYIKVMNPNREGVTGVGCELYDEDGVLLKSYSESCSYTTSYVNYTCNFNSDMGYDLSPGTTYQFMLYAVVGGKRLNDSMRTFQTTGTKTEDSGQADTDEPTPTVSEESDDVPAATSAPATVKKSKPTSSSSGKDISDADLEEDEDEDEDDSAIDSSSRTVTKPGKAGKPSVVSRGKKSLKITWRRAANVSGYQIQYAANRSMRNAKTKMTAKTSCTLKKLKKKKTYYIRVRAYRWTVSGKVYGKWSSVKKVRTRR